MLLTGSLFYLAITSHGTYQLVLEEWEMQLGLGGEQAVLDIDRGKLVCRAGGRARPVPPALACSGNHRGGTSSS